MRQNASYSVINTFKLDLIHQAIKILIDNPYLSNREVARRVGKSEKSIRYWKQQPFWETEKQKILSDRAEVLKKVIETNPQKYVEEFEKELEDLKKLRDAQKSLAALYFKLSSSTLTDVMATKKGVKASSEAYKSGVNKHSDSAARAANSVIQFNENIYQLGAILEELKKLEEQNG